MSVLPPALFLQARGRAARTRWSQPYVRRTARTPRAIRNDAPKLMRPDHRVALAFFPANLLRFPAIRLILATKAAIRTKGGSAALQMTDRQRIRAGVVPMPESIWPSLSAVNAAI